MVDADHLGAYHKAFFIGQRLSQQIESWAHPINENSAAFKDGRSGRPALPEAFVELNDLRTVNTTLGTNYTLEEIQDAPAMWIEKVILFSKAIQ